MMEENRKIRTRVAAIILEDDRILMVRHEKAGRRYWMLPGGGVDFGETMPEALIRELKEETGITIRVQDLVMANDTIAPDGCRHIINLYFTAERTGGEVAPGIDGRIVETAFLPVDSLPDLEMFPDFGRELHRLLREGFPGKVFYPGNLWKA